MQRDLYQVDAFTNKTFGGNPAAVCPLDAWLPDETLQNIALENNLSETVFFVPTDTGFNIRWFTPTDEVNLCGHATLAASYVIFNELNYNKDTIIFDSKSGELRIHKTPDGYKMDFPVWKHEQTDIPANIKAALGKQPIAYFTGPDHVALFETQHDIESITPDWLAMSKIDTPRGLLITAPGDNDDTDFVSRCFFPKVGVPEDPVTGSAHCILTPIWAEKLNKTKFKARQLSPRGGNLLCDLNGDRVEITGQAVLYMKGTIYV